MTEEEIHNIYLHMSGKAEGIAESTGSADFPVLFANAILEYAKRKWVGLTPEEVLDLFDVNNVYGSKWIEFARTVEAALKKKNT